MKWMQDEFAKRLEDAIERQGLTQKKFAASAKIGESTLSGWKDRSEPAFDDILKLSDKLGVRPAWLAFGDEFEPMDDEELRMITAWRKLTEPERAGFVQTLEAIAAERLQVKKPGRRTKSEPLSAVPLSTHNSAAQFASLLQQAETVERTLADLLLHEALLPVGSKAQISVENASTLLDRLVASLRSAQQQGQQSDSAASSPAKAPVSAKRRQGHTQSVLPYNSPTESKDK